MKNKLAYLIFFNILVSFSFFSVAENKEKQDDSLSNVILMHHIGIPNIGLAAGNNSKEITTGSYSGSDSDSHDPWSGKPPRPGTPSLPFFAILDSLFEMLGNDFLLARGESVVNLPDKLFVQMGDRVPGAKSGDSGSSNGEESAGEGESDEEEEENWEDLSSGDDIHDGNNDGDQPSDEDGDETDTAVNSPLNGLLFNAVEDGDYNLVEDLIHQGANVNAFNSRGETPLMVCAGHIHQPRHQKVLELLLKNKASRTPEGVTQLPAAIALDATARFTDEFKEQGYRMSLMLIGDDIDIRRFTFEQQKTFWMAFLQLFFNAYLTAAKPEQLMAVEQSLPVSYTTADGHHHQGQMNLNIVHLTSLFGTVEQMQILVKRFELCPDQIRDLMNTPLTIQGVENWRVYPLNLAAARHMYDFYPIMLSHGARLGRADHIVQSNQRLSFFRQSQIDKLNRLTPPGKTLMGIYRPGWQLALEQIHLRQKGREDGLINAIIDASSSPTENTPIILKAVEYLAQTRWGNETLTGFNKLLERVLKILQKADASQPDYDDIRPLRSMMMALGALIEANRNTHTGFDPIDWSLQFVDNPPMPPRVIDDPVYGNVIWAFRHEQHRPLVLIHLAHTVFLQYQNPDSRLIRPILPMNVASRLQNQMAVWLLLAMGECPLFAESQVLENEEENSSDYSVFQFVFGQAGNTNLQNLLISHLFTHEQHPEDVDEQTEITFWIERMLRIALENNNADFLALYLDKYRNTMKRINAVLVVALTPYLTTEEADEALCDDTDSCSDGDEFEYSYSYYLKLVCPYERDRLLKPRE